MYFGIEYRRRPQDNWEMQHQYKYDTPQAAMSFVKAQNDYWARYSHSQRYRVKKVVDTDDTNFYAREAALNHTPVPWESNVSKIGYPWMLPHVDPANAKHVRFFRNAEDAVCQKYTSITMSRFLSNYEDMDEDHASDILIKAGYYGDQEFGITNDPDKIIDIYTNGPSSCMNDPDEYDLPDPHPAIVYSEGDFAVAYIGSEGRYSSRAVVCKTKKLYYTVYGHTKLMKDNLEKEGYKYSSSADDYEGMRLKAIWHDVDDGWLMPYVDVCEYAKLDKKNKFFVLTPHYGGTYCIRMTGGYADPDEY